jgi:flavin reductase (DIM6/NTAB) family NADH-FMN oxidoreductase RutF
MKTIKTSDRETYDKRDWTRIINCLSGFKSVNLVGTASSAGLENLSVISSFFHLGARPPLMGFVVRPHSNKSPRHTLVNLKELGFYTLNAVTKENHLRGHQASARYPQDVSEFEQIGLKSVYKNDFKAPYVENAPLQVGFKLIDVMDVEHNGTHIVVGEIVELHVNEDMIKEDGFIDLEAGGVLALSGLDSYHETKSIHRLSYAKPELEVTEL